MPRQKPRRSKQDYGTPRPFLDAVERSLGPIDVDLAARVDNAKAPHFITPQQNSLRVSWSKAFPGALAWLNPEFADLGPWAAKCALEHGLRILLLTPASVGAAWFAAHVHNHALVLALRPRLTFEGCTKPYPKDCILSLFNFGRVGFGLWNWRTELLSH